MKFSHIVRITLRLLFAVLLLTNDPVASAQDGDDPGPNVNR